jgi:hypothetical protein
MRYGLFIETEASLKAMHKRAMRIGAFIVAERIAVQLNEPGALWVFQHRSRVNEE